LILDYETYWNPESGGNLAKLIRLFDEVSLDYKAVLFPPSQDQHPKNIELFNALSLFEEKDRFIPCAYINPNIYDSADDLEILVNTYGFRGVKLMPTIHRYNVDSIVTSPIMKKAIDLGLPVTIHSSGEGGYPRLIGKLAKSFPDVPIIMDHSGYRYFQDEAIEAGENNENIYFGLSLVVEPSFIDRIAIQIGADKLIYGSNAHVGIPKIALMVFEYTKLSRKEKRQALGENLGKLLNF
jgi:predicted TIM-barrel fold metal-dependent hydrolase